MTYDSMKNIARLARLRRLQSRSYVVPAYYEREYNKWLEIQIRSYIDDRDMRYLKNSS